MRESKPSNIVLLNPFHTGSHKQWAEGLIRHSEHHIHLLKMKGRNWKWRMHGAAIHFASELKKLNLKPDIFLSTDMMDMSTFRGLINADFPNAKFYSYFHENQISYPWSPNDQDVKLKRDYHYAFINYSTAIASDRIFFNSEYHLKSFIEGLREVLTHFPDYVDPLTVQNIKSKSKVLYLGMDLPEYPVHNVETEEPVLLWNHRWEYDKNPDLFFETLFQLKDEGITFKLIVTGESFSDIPAIFQKAKTDLKDQLLHFGYAKSKTDYYRLLSLANVIPVTNNQDFFGGSIVEAIHWGSIPLLPGRLAYPEHIPENLHSKFIYLTNQDFKSKLKAMLANHSGLRTDLASVQSHIKRYDWKELIKRYDHALAHD